MAKKTLTQLESRQKIIDDRAARVAALAKKKGMTVAELRKQERDTFLKVVGGAASLLPIGAIVRGATALLKGGKAVSTAVKGAKSTKTASTAAKASKLKPANRSSSQGGRTAAEAKTAAKPKTPAGKPTKNPATMGTKARKALAATTGIGAKTGRRSGMAIRGKDGRLSGVSKKTQDLGKRANTALKGAAATSIVLATADSLKNNGSATADARGSKPSVSSPTSRQPKMLVNAENFNKQKDRVVKKPKGDATPVSMPKSRPKRKGTDLPADFTKAKKNNNATNYGLGKMKKDSPKGPGVGKQDKEDKRENFKSKPVKNAALPAGAKPFKGGYNSKTHKLQNIRGKTYVVPKPKAKKK